MKYFEYVFLILFLLPIILPSVAYFVWLRLRHFQKLARMNILKMQQNSTSETFFSTEVINTSVLLLFLHHPLNKTALKNLICGRIRPTLCLFEKKDPMLALLLEAHLDMNTALKKISQNKKIWINHQKYAPFLPILLHLSLKPYSSSRLLQKISQKKLSRQARAYYHYISAYAYLQNADMLSASEHASQSLKYFQKHKYTYEEIASYIVLGEIYRLSCINDIAQTMLETALKISKRLPAPNLQAKITVALGMLMLYENRPNDTEKYYNEALKLNISQHIAADIYNQFALLKISQSDYKASLKYLQKSAQHSLGSNNFPTKAFQTQLLGQIYLEQKHYKKAADQFLKAENLYKKTENFSAQAECIYSLAETYEKYHKFNMAETNLRHLISFTHKYPGNFHIAHAYSLLALIYMQRHDLNRAKALLQQSLQLEQKNNRSEGLVADYANLALIENLRGNKDASQNNLHAALEFAKKTENQHLIKLIENKFRKN